jgi:hypothetical protein
MVKLNLYCYDHIRKVVLIDVWVNHQASFSLFRFVIFSGTLNSL